MFSNLDPRLIPLAIGSRKQIHKCVKYIIAVKLKYTIMQENHAAPPLDNGRDC